MQVPDKPKTSTNSESELQRQEKDKCLSFASTEEATALLSELGTRSPSQREFLGKLLKRAATRATSTDSVVDHADSHHTSTP